MGLLKEKEGWCWGGWEGWREKVGGGCLGEEEAIIQPRAGLMLPGVGVVIMLWLQASCWAVGCARVLGLKVWLAFCCWTGVVKTHTFNSAFAVGLVCARPDVLVVTGT